MMYDALTLVTPPAVDFLPDETVYEHLRLPLSGSPPVPADQVIVSAFKGAVQTHLDGAQGILGRALVTQTWRATYRTFPAGNDPVIGAPAVWLPLPPLQSVSSIEYVDSDGVVQTLSTSAYDVVVRGIHPGYVLPAFGQTWPTARDEAGAVRITFVAGFGDNDTDVDDAIVAAALLMLGDLYDNRAAQGPVRLYSNPAVDRLLAPLRLTGIGYGA